VEPDRSLTRRQLLIGAAGLAGAGALARHLLREPARPAFGGEIVGASHAIGHRLRGGSFPPVSGVERTGVVVVGGGVSGLSAGWRFRKAGFSDFKLLDLEAEAGGNARSGRNALTGYPWGAHYLPFPTKESRAVSELLRELGVETGRDGKGRPVYDDRYVCFAPQERIFIHGRWQEGLFPKLGSSARDLEQLRAFNAEMTRFRKLVDAEGRRAFAIPMELSSRRPDLLDLDGISMADYLLKKGWDSPRLRWFVEYACRDDFGCRLEQTSAWAAVHYFAARNEGEEDQVLTWPEGNGWLARKLEERLGGRIETSALAYAVRETGEGVEVDCFDVRKNTSRRLKARAAVLCVPQFVASRLLGAKRGKGFSYAPWMVANLEVQDPPAGAGAAPAWDNVLFEGDSLGYVDATHQSLSQDRRATVWTYYLPLTGEPDAERRKALERSWGDWRDVVLRELRRPHPGLERRIRRLDVMVWGHGMVRPAVGFMWGKERQEASRPLGRVFFGHSDLSGFSIFEEAQYRGIKAAEDALRALGRSAGSLL
jgi:phytoene dehydrogenase-like protein